MGKKAEETLEPSTESSDASGEKHSVKLVLLDQWDSLTKVQEVSTKLTNTGKHMPMSDFELLQASAELALNLEVVDGWHFKGQVNLYGAVFLVFEKAGELHKSAEEVLKKKVEE